MSAWTFSIGRQIDYSSFNTIISSLITFSAYVSDFHERNYTQRVAFLITHVRFFIFIWYYIIHISKLVSSWLKYCTRYVVIIIQFTVRKVRWFWFWGFFPFSYYLLEFNKWNSSNQYISKNIYIYIY